jgi:polyisoprenoid-binding protein YceI
MNRHVAAIILAGILAVAPAATAQRQTFTVDPASSQVGFSLAATGHRVEGTFHVQSGVVDFDRTARSISGKVVVSASSGSSGDSGRDRKMNAEVLNPDQFAEISFIPKSFQGAIAASGDSTIQVSGVFTLRGVAHDITVPTQIHIDGAKLIAKGHFVVPYVQWGLKDPSVFILKVGKEVDIDLNLAGTVSPAS